MPSRVRNALAVAAVADAVASTTGGCGPLYWAAHRCHYVQVAVGPPYLEWRLAPVNRVIVPPFTPGALPYRWVTPTASQEVC